MIRRLFAAAAAALTLALAAPVLAQSPAPAPAPERASVTVDGRAVDVVIWPAEGQERALIVFSHGYGGQPAAYRRLISAWTAAGFTVVAPLHVDSEAHPNRADFDGPTGFFARVADLSAVRDLARTRNADVPLIAAGHSYGSLMSAIAGGAVTLAGPLRDADVDAVILVSSAGKIPGLITPQTYAGLAVPTLTITGDLDLVPGYVADWRDHRAAFDGAPGTGHLLLTFADGDHLMIRDADAADFEVMATTTVDFIRARALADAEAAARLDALAPTSGVMVERR